MKINKKDIDRVYNQSIIKEGNSEGFFNVFIFRKISIHLSWLLAYLDISPNKITIFSFVIGLIASFLFSFGFYYYTLFGLFFYIIANILDMSDGEVARLTGKFSEFGHFLDPFLDRVLNFIFLGGVSYGVYVESGNNSILFLYVFYLIFSFLNLYLNSESKNLGGLSGKEYLIKTTHFISNDNIKKYIRWDGGFSCVILTFFVLIDKLYYFILFLLFFYIFIFLALFVGIVRKLNA